MPKKKNINKNKNKIIININSNNKKKITRTPSHKPQQSMPFIINNPSHLPYLPQQNPYINGAMANNQYGIGDTKLLNALQGSMTDLKMKQESQMQELINTRQHNEELKQSLKIREQDRKASSKAPSSQYDYLDTDSNIYPSYKIPINEPLDDNVSVGSGSYILFDRDGKKIQTYHRGDTKSISEDSLNNKIPDTQIRPYFTAPKLYTNKNTLEGESRGTIKLDEMRRDASPIDLKQDFEEERRRRGKKTLEERLDITSEEATALKKSQRKIYNKERYNNTKRKNNKGHGSV